ncbi:MAG: GAF domain-containing protein [Bacteroidales bacterium]|nr:GAF domain-containing protein [Bacteroidales bacterium]
MKNDMVIRENTKPMLKEEKYQALLPQVEALCEGEDDMIAKMANISALLHREFGFWWTGFYRVEATSRPRSKGEEGLSQNTTHRELVLGPFQGPLACVHIGYGKGVCGTAWKERRTVVVADVERFPGHIACSSESRSEIVVPMFRGDEVVAVLDIDSRHLATFDDTDRRCLEQLVAAMA